MAWLLALATILGGAAAIWYFSDRLRPIWDRRSRLVRRARAAGVPEALLELPDEILRVPLESAAWEYAFFCELLQYRIHQKEHLRRDLRFGSSSDRPVNLGAAEALRYVGDRMKELGTRVEQFSVLVNEAYNEAIAPDGVPADLMQLDDVACRLGTLYGEATRISIGFKEAHVPPDIERLFELCSGTSEELARKVEEVANRTWWEMKKTELLPKTEADPAIVTVQVDVGNIVSQELKDEFAAVLKKYRIEGGI